MYHVSLNGQGYLIDLRSYRRRSQVAFAPKTASGNRSYGDLVHDQAYSVSDWRGGEGFLQVDPSHLERWRAGAGVDVFSEPGSLRLGPHAITITPTTAYPELTAAAVFRGDLYVGTSTGDVWRWNGTTWALSLATGMPGGIRALAVFNGKLYAGNGANGQVAELTSTGVWTNPKFTIAGSLGVWSMATFYRQAAQYLYLVSAGSTNAGIYWWDGFTLSGLQYQPEESGDRSVSLVLSNRLYFFVGDTLARRSGIYSVDDSGSGGVYRAHQAVEDNYVAGGAVVNGLAYLGSGLDGVVWSWDGGGLHPVRQLGSVAAPYGSPLRALASWNGALWLAARDGPTVSLFRYDGSGWSRPVAGLTVHGAAAPTAAIVYAGRLHACMAATATTSHIWVTAPSFGANGTLETGLFDAGLPSVDKVLRTATLTHAPLAAGESIQVQYRLEDAGSWVALGTSDVDGTTSGTFSFPGTVTCRQVGFRLLLVGSGGSASSPVLYDFLLRYALAPEQKREWDLSVVLEGTPELPLVRLDGSPEPLTGPQLSAALWTAKATAGPVTFVDLDGASRTVWFEDLREEVSELSQRKGYQTIGRVRLLEE